MRSYKAAEGGRVRIVLQEGTLQIFRRVNMSHQGQNYEANGKSNDIYQVSGQRTRKPPSRFSNFVSSDDKKLFSECLKPAPAPKVGKNRAPGSGPRGSEATQQKRITRSVSLNALNASDVPFAIHDDSESDISDSDNERINSQVIEDDLEACIKEVDFVARSQSTAIKVLFSMLIPKTSQSEVNRLISIANSSNGEEYALLKDIVSDSDIIRRGP